MKTEGTTDNYFFIHHSDHNRVFHLPDFCFSNENVS